MNISVQIVDGPIPPPGQGREGEFAGAGAVVEFRGIVRPAEAGAPIDALEYEAYLPMAQRELERLARAAVCRHGLIAVHIWHSRGRVAAGECSLRILIGAERRKAAIAAVDELVDELKREVPIWKRIGASGGVRGNADEHAGEQAHEHAQRP